jgi:CRP-like cAMP-binding protein
LDKLSFIKKLFYDASDKEIQIINNLSSIIELNYNNNSFKKEHNLTNYMYIVIEGFIKLYNKNKLESEFTIDILGPGDFFGEGAILDIELYQFHTFFGEAKLLKIDFKEMQENMFKDCPMLSNFIFTESLNRIRKITQRMCILLEESEVKVAKSIIFLANIYGTRENGYIKFSFPGQKEFALFANCSRETVSRILNKFVSLNLIEYDRRKFTEIIIKDYGSFLNHYN